MWITVLSPFISQAPAFADLGILAKSSFWRLWSQFAQHHGWPVHGAPVIVMVALFRHWWHTASVSAVQDFPLFFEVCCFAHGVESLA